MNQNASDAECAQFPGLHEDLFSNLESAQGILIAVSGGSDSMALLALLARWHVRRPAIQLQCATVDHGLRPESAVEAQCVARLCAQLNIPHTLLQWGGPKPRAGLEKAAREARYALLWSHALSQGLTHVVTAHTLDDQAETVLMRLAAGSGLRGLAAMRLLSQREGLYHVRPLLGIRKRDLQAFLSHEKIKWCEDAMNQDERFMRVKLRRSSAFLEQEGLTAARLSVFAKRAGRAEEALDLQAQEFFSRLMRANQDAFEGEAALLMPLHEEFLLRVLQIALDKIDGAHHYPRLGKLEKLLGKLQQAWSTRQPCAYTLMGVKFTLRQRKTGFYLRIALAPPRQG